MRAVDEGGLLWDIWSDAAEGSGSDVEIGGDVGEGDVGLKPGDEGVFLSRKYPIFRANDNICP